MYKERIQQLVSILKEKNLYGYLVFSSDYHSSEYIVDYFKACAFLSGFTGSAGTLLVTIRGSYLWTDGRYFIQAEQQLKESGVQLMKMGEVKTPTLIEFLKQDMQENEQLAFDAKVATYQFVKNLKQEIKGISLKLDEDLVSLIWKDRPSLPLQPIVELKENLTGESIASKLEKVRTCMKDIQYHLLSSLDDIAYLFNLRGKDIPYNPVFLSYALISHSKAYLFIDEQKVSLEIKQSLEAQGVTLLPYEKIYSVLKTLTGSILLDPNKINYALYVCIDKSVKIFKSENPTTLMKAIKNPVEIENTKRIHLQDGVAFCKFMIAFKKQMKNQTSSELQAQDLLESFRKEQKDYLEPSFSTICAYQENAAMMHYSATLQSNKTIRNEGLLLIDSGGQYLGGTTDITRTLVLGSLSKEAKYHFTLALKSHIALASVCFLRGCRGISLDILARKPLWDVGLDYKCGTGHGVGYMLNVHEGPNSFRYNMNPNFISAELKEGMITTNEPGIYLENQYGIRHENEMLTVFSHQNEYGEFLKFEPITYVPFDIDGIDASLLTSQEKQWLNNYHQMVYEKISPYLNDQEKETFKEYTKELY